MSDLAGIVEPLGSLEIGGTTYLVEPITPHRFLTWTKWIEDWFEKKGESVMDGPLACVVKDPSWATLSAEEKKIILQSFGTSLAAQPKRKKITDEEIQERTTAAARTAEGIAYLVWILIKKNHPTVTYEQLIEPVRAANPMQVQLDLYKAADFKSLEEMIKRRAGSEAKN